tara:strand:+ start:68 stop:658 length:591 start_codon:yes stop_codon:yes gene_type:complete
MNPYILVLYFSQSGGTANLAQEICYGIDGVKGIESRLRTVPSVSTTTEQTKPIIPDEGAIYCEKQDLADCAGLALGSATRFGNMSGSMKHFLDSTADLWMTNSLVGKPASLFTSSNSLHGGQETTLLSMMIPLFHHGMCIIGLPYSESALKTTKTGGTPYGVTHLGSQGSELSDEEQELARKVGSRLAETALALIR